MSTFIPHGPAQFELSTGADRVGFEWRGKAAIVHMGQEPVRDVIEQRCPRALTERCDVYCQRRGDKLSGEKLIEIRDSHR